MVFLKSIKLGGFLSFAPDSPAIELTPLNVLIGPNGSGKSNLIEAIEVLRSAPTSLASYLRSNGGAEEFVWKGKPAADAAIIEVAVERNRKAPGASAYRLVFPELYYRLKFVSPNQIFEVAEETIRASKGADKEFRYELKRKGSYFTAVGNGLPASRRLPKGRVNDLIPDESVLAQRKDPLHHPELSWLAQQFGRTQTFRNWTFGRNAPLRRPERGDMPIDELLPSSENLGLILNELQHHEAIEQFNNLLSKFLPRYERYSTRIYANSIQIFLHERGLQTPVPAARLSDGTIRFMAILALLLSPTPPPLLCIEEPELGLHPDVMSFLADLIVEASTRMQLIITTHSDALISALTSEAGSVLVCDNRGGTVFERVDPSRLKHWLGKYRLGEIWRIGELGGNP